VNVLPEQKRPGNPEEVSELTREQIERLRPPSHLPPGVAIVSDELQNALCDLALRALAPPQIQEQHVAGSNKGGCPTVAALKAYQAGASSGSPDAVQSVAAAACQWIAVSERLPDHDGEVLIYTPTGKYNHIDLDAWREQREAPVSFSSVTVPTGFMWDNHEFDDVTHWMPLPPPPSQDKP
jgi:hypothetical protein